MQAAQPQAALPPALDGRRHIRHRLQAAGALAVDGAHGHSLGHACAGAQTGDEMCGQRRHGQRRRSDCARRLPPAAPHTHFLSSPPPTMSLPHPRRTWPCGPRWRAGWRAPARCPPPRRPRRPPPRPSGGSTQEGVGCVCGGGGGQYQSLRLHIVAAFSRQGTKTLQGSPTALLCNTVNPRARHLRRKHSGRDCKRWTGHQVTSSSPAPCPPPGWLNLRAATSSTSPLPWAPILPHLLQHCLEHRGQQVNGVRVAQPAAASLRRGYQQREHVRSTWRRQHGCPLTHAGA